MDPDTAERLRRVIHKLARHLNADATAEGLTPTQASVLGVVVDRGPVGSAGIVSVEQLNPTLLSRVLTRLEELGLVQRKADPQDQRAVTVRATDEGRALHFRLRDERARSLARLVTRLDAGERASLEASLSALEQLVVLAQGEPRRDGSR